MDYIQGELLRQTRAFAALLGEETSAESDSGTNSTGKNPSLEESWAARLRRQSEINTQAAAAALGLSGNGEVTAANPTARGTSPARSGSVRTAWNRAYAKNEDVGADTAQVLLVQDGGLSAVELSRIFERDARRYNGAYPLY